MARLAYECNLELKNASETALVKPFACNNDKYCLYCCCNPQCCLLVQRKPPRHVWEAWYFWLGLVLVTIFIVSTVSSYIVSNCRHKVGTSSDRPNPRNSNNNNNNNAVAENGPNTGQNDISISIIPTVGVWPANRKMVFIASQPSLTHMTPVIA